MHAMSGDSGMVYQANSPFALYGLKIDVSLVRDRFGAFGDSVTCISIKILPDSHTIHNLLVL